MRPIHSVLAVSVLSLTLIAAGAMPASARDSQGDEDQNSQGENNQGGGAPEIDPGLLGGVVTLVAGGLLILRERRRG